MLKVMIIDDEQWSLDYMLGLVDWNENGAEVVATFNNALDAISFLAQNSDIDLVFVDVEMPEMTGLEFLRRAGELSKTTSFVIISSYDIFNYAQEALRSGAKDYLLKPVEQSDVMRIIADTVGVCEENTKEVMGKSNIAALPANDAQKRLEDIWNIGEEESILCCVTDVPDTEISEIFTACLKDEYDIRCYHSVWHHAFFVKASTEDVEELVKTKKSECRYRFGFYIAQKGNESIDDMLIKAKGAFEGVFFSSNANVFVYDNNYEQWSANHIFKVKKYLDDRQITSVHNCIDDFYAELEEKFIQADTGILFYNRVIDYLTNNSTAERSNYFLIDIRHAEKKFEGREELIQFLHCLVDEWAMEFAGEAQVSKAKDFIPRIQKYINENCQNELNLSVLAKEFMISGKYLSSVFKKTTGMNLNRYINLARVKKAAVMLEQTEISVQDVSYLCGYNDCSYFTKIFKQMLGLTPSEYRISKQEFQD